MKKTKASLLLILMMATQPALAASVNKELPSKSNNGLKIEEPISGKFTGSVGVTSDYTFRGVSQTKEKPALQASVEYEDATGLYIGGWASNVDFTDARTEIDGYGGYRFSAAEDIALDLGFIYYAYPDAGSSFDYDYYEFYAGGKYKLESGADIGLKLNYSPENFADSGDSYYAALSSGIALADSDFRLDGRIGRVWVEDNLTFALPDYTEWAIGLSYTLMANYQVKVEYIDTNISKAACTDGCDSKAVATLSLSF